MVAPSSSRYGAKSDRRPNLASSAGPFSNGQMRHLIYVKSFLKRQKTTRLTLRQFAKRRSVQRCASSRSKARLSGQLASYSRREICSLSIGVAWRSPAMSNAVTRCRSLLRTPAAAASAFHHRQMRPSGWTNCCGLCCARMGRPGVRVEPTGLRLTRRNMRIPALRFTELLPTAKIVEHWGN